MIERTFSADRVNAIANHPAIRQWVNPVPEFDLDLGPALADPDNIALIGEHGAIVSAKLQPNIYEVHTMVRPEGRGAWGLQFVRGCLAWMFCRTDALELLTRCPKGNLAAKALVRTIHGTYQFTNPAGWSRDGMPIPADVHALTVQDWMRTAHGIEERGRWFHDRIGQEFAACDRVLPRRSEDEMHDRYMGATVGMMLGGQVVKAVVMYNRWASMAGYAQISIVGQNPPAIDIGIAVIVLNGEDFFVPVIREIH